VNLKEKILNAHMHRKLQSLLPINDAFLIPLFVASPFTVYVYSHFSISPHISDV